MLMAFHFLTGFFGSPILAMGGPTIAGLHAPKMRAYRMTLRGVFASCALSLGPPLGSFSARFEGWLCMIWELMWLSFATFVLHIFFPETSASNILYYRARHLRKATGNHSSCPLWRSLQEVCHAVTVPSRSSYTPSRSTYNANGKLKPEECMPVAIVGTFIVPISLFWFGWTSRASVLWIVPIISPSLFSIAALLLL